MSNKQQIEESLKSLILDDTRAFVAMLSGEWGIGKTYFWKEFTKKYLKDKGVVYISLFGKNSLADIETEIVTKLYKYNKGLKKYTKHLDTVGNMASKAIGLPINVSAGSLLSLFSPSDFKKIILCFDDFERLSDKVPLKDVMGLISQFKEQKECKVIMILNEKELDKLSDIDGKKHGEIFTLYKEKVVDYNFHYHPSQEELFQAIKEDITKITFCEHQTIYNFFKKIDLTNIRIMKQALYLLGKFSFIESKGYNKKVIDEFVEIALNLFIFKAKSNYTYEDFYEMQKYKSHDSHFCNKDTGTLVINEQHEKNLAYYHKIPYNNANISTEELIYTFIDTHQLNDSSFKDLFDIKSMHLDKENIREQFSSLEDSLLRSFSSPIETIICKIYELLNKNKQLIPHIIDISTLHKYFEYIQEHNKALLPDAFIKDYILSYFDIKPKNRRYSFQIDAYENFISYNYPNLVQEIKQKKVQELKDNLTIKQISELLSKTHRGWNPEDAYILNNIDTQTYIQYLEKSTDFYSGIIAFLPFHMYTNSFSTATKNIKNALLLLKDKNNDNTWRINKMLKEANIDLEEDK